MWFIVLMLITQRLTAHLHSVKTPPYVINLDPAVHHMPYPANIGDQLLLNPPPTLHLSLCLSFTDTERHNEVQAGTATYGCVKCISVNVVVHVYALCQPVLIRPFLVCELC